MRTLIVPAAVAVAVLAGATSAAAQPFSPYAAFQSLPDTRLPGLQIKLSHLGSQRQRLVTRLLIANGAPVVLHQFLPYRRAGYAYGTDDDSVVVVRVPTTALRAILDEVAGLPGVTDGGVDPGGRLSFAMVDSIGGTIGFESIVDAANGRALFARLAQALGNDPGAARVLDHLACLLDLRSLTVAEDVTASTTALVSGVRYHHREDAFVGRLRVTNTSASPISAPLSVAFDGLLRIHLLGSSGATCRTTPRGSPYVDVLTSGSLAPGAFLDVTVTFDNPALDPIEATTRVLAGAGSR